MKKFYVTSLLAEIDLVLDVRFLSVGTYNLLREYYLNYIVAFHKQ